MGRRELDFNPYSRRTEQRERTQRSLCDGKYTLTRADYDKWAPWMTDRSLLPKKPPGRN
jgi:hypothetical protein